MSRYQTIGEMSAREEIDRLTRRNRELVDERNVTTEQLKESQALVRTLGNVAKSLVIDHGFVDLDTKVIVKVLTDKQLRRRGTLAIDYRPNGLRVNVTNRRAKT